MNGNGTTAASTTVANDFSIYPPSAVIGGSSRRNAVFQIMDYSATDKHKTVLYRYDNPGVGTMAAASRYASTSAVTVVKAEFGFAAGDTFALYGIAA